ARTVPRDPRPPRATRCTAGAAAGRKRAPGRRHARGAARVRARSRSAADKPSRSPALLRRLLRLVLLALEGRLLPAGSPRLQVVRPLRLELSHRRAQCPVLLLADRRERQD